jgi:uncharacterized protein YlxW (UPF0749 family)
MKHKQNELNVKTLLKVDKEREEMQELKQEIRDLEAELDWADSQAADDYKYISNLENRLDLLYEKFDKLDAK